MRNERSAGTGYGEDIAVKEKTIGMESKTER